MRTLLTIFLLIPFVLFSQEIALTFDDAPTADGPLLSASERSDLLISTLRREGVSEACFFVLTRHIDNDGGRRLKKYAAAGHLLANHSGNHLWMHEAGVDQYIRDIALADSILNTYPNYERWYRYPYLDEGRTVQARDAVREALGTLNLKNGYVTVDNYDWYLNGLVRKAVEAGQKVDKKILRDIYVEHIYQSILFYDAVAKKHLGRSPKHVLLLHENDLAALFLGDLIEHLKARGWKIISPREAYTDPISSEIPDVLFNGQGRVAAIARASGTPAKDLVQNSEDEAFLDALVKSRKVFK